MRLIKYSALLFSLMLADAIFVYWFGLKGTLDQLQHVIDMARAFQ